MDRKGMHPIPRILKAAAIALVVIAFQPYRSAGATPPGKGNRPPNLQVITEISDLDSNGLPSTIASDSQGTYLDGGDGVSSILTSNVCNGLTWGDWRFDAQASTRTVTESFFHEDAIGSDDPHYQADANPPYWGSAPQHVWMNVQCTCTGKSMYTMTKDTSITCPLLNNWNDSAGNKWSFSPANSNYSGFPEATDAQITCNQDTTDATGRHCVDWVIDPIGAAEGTEAVGRVNETPNTHGKATIYDDGDFYMRFHIHVILP
jgi:hypothetical protein